MGAEIQYNMYVPGFHSTRDLSNGTVNGGRSWRHESRIFSQYSDLFPTSPAMRGYMAYEKEQLRQTILQQERIFRHQVHELHRLYKVQKDIMNEFRHINTLRHSKSVEMSQTTFCAKLSPQMRHDSTSPSADLNYGRTSFLGSTNLHSSMNSKAMQSDCDSVSKRSRFADDGSQKKLQRRLFDLEVPADVEEELQMAYRGSGFESCPSNANSNVNDERNNIGDKLSSNVHTRVQGSLNLNEPIQIDETSVTTSAGVVSDTCFSKEQTHGSSLAGSEKGHELEGNHVAKRIKSIIFGMEIISDVKEPHHYSGSLGSVVSNGICDSNSASEPNTQQSATDENKVAGWLVNRKSADNVTAMSNPTLNSENHYQDLLSGKDAHITKDEGNCSSNGKSLVVSVFGKNIMEDLSSASPASMPTSSAPGDRKSSKTGPFQPNLDHDPLSSVSKEEQSLKGDVVKRNSVCSDKVRWNIDLNLSMTEDEAHFTKNTVAANVKNVVEIDLEVPVVDETDMVMSSASKPLDRKSREHISIDIESGDAVEEYIKFAAEALLAISYDTHVSEDDATSHKSKATLQWFAEVLSLYYDCTDSITTELANKDDCEDSSDKFDYFERMTLKLSETKEEIHPYKPQVLESIEEDTMTSRRPCRGPARRGRQRKDFQGDVLPSLVSLAINDVTEDLHMLEGLVKATGGSWQSSLSLRPSSKSRGRRGRKRSAAPSAASLTVTQVSPPPTQQPKCTELGTEETRLSGWGRRSRRPPRQRYQINNPQPVQ